MFEFDRDILLEVAHFVEHLDSVASPVANVDQTVVVHGHAMKYGHERIADFDLRAVQVPLAKELPGAIKHRYAMVPAGSFAIGHINVAVLGIDRDASGFEKRRVAGV